ncbi:hypothetical protein PoB_002505300 [Plakobranchus ocellatus]|uniref:Uncharacterized protein n=1 Tax=Plakobranchus ocellatus TaxID=259542 RepID=A0AAV3ZVS9_9GAST|nr:hypothetical protein PoB_002505300 [Plakobranchus ocellatus]
MRKRRQDRGRDFKKVKGRCIRKTNQKRNGGYGTFYGCMIPTLKLISESAALTCGSIGDRVDSKSALRSAGTLRRGFESRHRCPGLKAWNHVVVDCLY